LLAEHGANLGERGSDNVGNDEHALAREQPGDVFLRMPDRCRALTEGDS
jgi:hypothetical protein